MSSGPSANRSLQFDNLALDLETDELWKDGELVKLQAQPFKVLALLAGRSGRVVTREEIQRKIWSGDTFVDFDKGIYYCIKEIRSALQDDTEHPRYVETVPKKGYRFLPSPVPTKKRAFEREEAACPYPGLIPFSEADAEFFFGREEEVESLFRKLERRHLLALIGPSGSGKTSLIRAGLIPALPEDWDARVFRPGQAPFAALAEALASEHTFAVEDLDAVFSALETRRGQHAEVLLVVDQFEELFTMSDEGVQGLFGEFLVRAAQEVGVRVLLSFRDDFLMRCHGLVDLDLIFQDLTPLEPPKGGALRRALVEAAARCGYRFESEPLVVEILTEVTRERGALPLLAFAAARLWEKRDREKKLLTREAYLDIGGVGGALAQHAEATLDRIGSDRLPVVRELFRNLATPQGTRVSRKMEELLSVFPDRESAKEVIRIFIDARLLTSFELPSGEAEGEERHRVEIIHESLLSAWPRLVRWQTQDQEGAQLREELRQAAQLWEQHGRSTDRLWTGTAVKEFLLWRERYPGGLTTTEEAFAGAMVEQAQRMRRRRRTATASIFTFLIGALAVVGVSRQDAVWQARRAEASRLVALGRLEVDRYPTASLAYARKSLELADNLEARRLAVEALWQGPTARILPLEGLTSWSAEFSPDGRWLASYTFSENVLLFPEDGGPPRVMGGNETPMGPPGLAFTPEGNTLLSSAATENHPVRMLSIPDGRELRLIVPGSPSDGRRWFWEATLPQGIVFSIREATDPNVHRHEIWPYEGGSPQLLGTLRTLGAWFLDDSGSQIAHRRGERILVRPVAGPTTTPEREIATVAEGVRLRLKFSPQGDRLAVTESTGRLTLWPLDPDAPREPLVLHQENPDIQFMPEFDVKSSRIVWGSQRSSSLWRLDGPPSADPVVLKRGALTQNKKGAFHPSGDWLAVANHESLTLWATGQTQSFVLRGHQSVAWHVYFTNDSKWLISCGQYDGVRTWPLNPRFGVAGSIGTEGSCNGLAVAPDGRILVGEGTRGVRVISSSGDVTRQLMERFPDGGIWGVAFDGSGRRAALSTYYSPGPPKKIRIWDLESGDLLRELPLVPPGESGSEFEFGAIQLLFTPGGELLSAGERGVRRFDTETGSSEWIWQLERGWEAYMASSQDGRRLLATARPNTVAEDHLVVLFDLAEGTQRSITSHGTQVVAVALDPTGTIIVTGDEQGVVRVGAADDGEPHLLFGHGEAVNPKVSPLSVSPDGRWIASGAGAEIRLWPMPDLSKPPLHTLPLDQLLAKLRELTNLQVIEDEALLTGYRLEIGPFPGWETVPEW